MREGFSYLILWVSSIRSLWPTSEGANKPLLRNYRQEAYTYLLEIL